VKEKVTRIILATFRVREFYLLLHYVVWYCCCENLLVEASVRHWKPRNDFI